jgi:hypothetical protein
MEIQGVISRIGENENEDEFDEAWDEEDDWDDDDEWQDEDEPDESDDDELF